MAQILSQRPFEPIMILDIRDNAWRYTSLHKGFIQAFEFLARPDLARMTPGRYEIDGDSVYASISLDDGGEKEEGVLEVHEKYIDIQMVLDGFDDIGWAPRSACTLPLGEYDPAEDIRLYRDTPHAWLGLYPGFFAIFFPEDAHMPLISKGKIHKVVMKIAL